MISYLDCKCPKTQTVNANVKPGEMKALVSWSEPKPTSCKPTPGIKNPKSTNEHFSVGEYKLTNTYTHGTKPLKCCVKIVVSGMLYLLFNSFENISLFVS